MRLAVHSSKLSAKNSVLNKENVHSELIVNRCPVTIYRQSGASEPNPQQQGLKPVRIAEECVIAVLLQSPIHNNKD